MTVGPFGQRERGTLGAVSPHQREQPVAEARVLAGEPVGIGQQDRDERSTADEHDVVVEAGEELGPGIAAPSAPAINVAPKIGPITKPIPPMTANPTSTIESALTFHVAKSIERLRNA